MTTVKDYFVCPHCGWVVIVTHDDKKPVGNLLLCPNEECSKNIFSDLYE